MTGTIISSALKSATFYTVVAITAVALLFVAFEPTVSRSASATSVFTVSQTITGEISFLVSAANVTMAGAINGLTGGNATGTTQAVVQTNNSAGYTMDISFSGSPAMLGNTGAGTGIRDYVGATPSFAFTSSSSALFAYTVSASTTSDIAPAFLDNSSSCGVGAGDTVNACWKGPTTGTYRIVSRATAAASGATTTIQFRVNVPNNPSPSVNSDTYTATATLTAVNQ